jgi:hypothetical protein
MTNFAVLPVGKRQGRKSMVTDIFERGEKLFRVHSDGADGKCQIHRLPIKYCHIMLKWDQILPQ